VALVQKYTNQLPEVLVSKIASQIDIHALTGGVVPEVAAREHTDIVMPLVRSALEEAGMQPEELSGIAVTVGPGLMPALSVGVTAARSLAYGWQKPLIPVHHLEGHIYSALLQDEPVFPALALIVSGGHTLLISIPDHLTYQILGSTRDDAAGEAFDKVARLLGLPYPGGPSLSKLALEGNPTAFKFTRPMLNSGDLDFSFSGLKTDVLYTIRDLEKDNKPIPKADVAASFQEAVVETLVKKTEQAIRAIYPKVVLLSGGVAANDALRNKMHDMVSALKVPLRISPREFCGDNAVMIGQVGAYAAEVGRFVKWNEIDAAARVSIEHFSIGH
jgi:N6-L-threonylcarbamoyladenine synthase